MKRMFFVSLCGMLALPLLLAAAADLLSIAETGSPEEIQKAIQNGADVNAVDSAGRTVLMLAAAFNSDPSVVTVLVKAGARANARGPHGWTPLMMAAYSNPNPEVVLALLKAGADPRLRSESETTAFTYALDNPALRGTPALERLKAGGR